MKRQTNTRIEQRKMKNQTKRNAFVLLGVLACLVLVCTVYNLILPALTMANDTYCGNPEHEHTLACYSNPEADVEGVADWEATLPKATGNLRQDMTGIAESQKGYRESEKNYQVEGTDVKKGYSRYGSWFGDPYGDWNLYFTEFVANYAKASLPVVESPDALMVSLKADGRWLKPSDQRVLPGDVVFYQENGKTMTGILKASDGKNRLELIAGDVENQVKRVVFAKNDPQVLGVGTLVKPEPIPKKAASEAIREGVSADVGEKKSGKKLFALSAPKAASVDMTSMIRSVVMQYNKNGRWEKIWDGQDLSKESEIRVRIDYELNGKTLGDGRNTVTYQIPNQIKLLEEESGKVYNSEGVEVGTYQISGSGLITITFYDEFVDSNAKGYPIQGSVTFHGKVNTSQSEGDEEVAIDFTDDIVIHVNMKDKEELKGNLNVKKEAVKMEQSGLIQYTVKVSSSQGTFDQVVLTDTMEGLTYESGFQVKTGSGAPVHVSNPPRKGAKKYEITLPQMKPNDSYEITYIGRADTDAMLGYGNNMLAKNSAVAASKNSSKHTISSTGSSTTPFEGVKKDGVYDAQKDLITWTVRVNGDRLDLSGWELRDKISGAEAPKKAILIDSSGRKTEITLPYTFPNGSRDAYTIQYTTKPLHNNVGDDRVVNQVALYKDNAEHASAVKEIGVGTYNPVEKKAGKPKLEKGAVVTPWTITVHGMEGVLGEVRIHDLLPESSAQGEYFTRAQLEDAKQIITKTMQENGITISDWKVCLFGTGGDMQEWNTESSNDRYRGFEYRIETKKPRNTSVSYTVKTSAVPKNEEMTLKNRAGVSGKVAVEVNTKYTPETLMLKKTDPSPGGNNRPISVHQYNELYQGETNWHVDLKVPEKQWNEDVTLTEHLPQGCQLINLVITAGRETRTDVSRDLFHKENAEASLRFMGGGKDSAMQFQKTGQKLTIQIPKGLHDYANGTYRFNIYVKMTDEVAWSGKENSALREATLTNKVEAQNTDTHVNAEQTQIIQQKKLDEVISKTGKLGENNVVTYTIPVNPEALDLIAESDVLYVTDVMSHTDNKALHANLVPGSVKYTTADGKVVVPKYTYHEKQNDGWEGRNSYRLRIELPDETALSVSYQYRFSGSTSQKNIPVSNKAILEGLGEGNGVYDNRISLELQDSGATANIKGILIYKVDENDQGHFLEGAEFALSRYDSAKKDYVPVKNKDGGTTFTSDGKGRLRLTEETVEAVLYNTAYKLVETKAPKGYTVNPTPYYFYLDQPDTNTYPVSKPDGFKGDCLYDGSLVYFTDAPQKTDLELIKVWKDEDGSDLADPKVKEVTVTVYREVEGGEKEAVKTVTVKASEDWKATVSGLPLTEVNEDGTPGAVYLYSVEEEPVEGFRVSYDHKDVHQGRVTITNTKEAGYVLPETGGSGLFPYLAGGAALMILAVVLAVRKRMQV